MPGTALDLFKGDGFSMREMTDAIRIIPTQYGLINKLGLFKDKGVRTTTVSVERKNGTLSVLTADERGGQGSANRSGKRDLIPLEIPHFELHDSIKAEDIQNVRQFGSESELENVQDVVNEKLAEMKAKHEITLEYLRAGALQGKVKDGSGTTLVNLFEKFGITQKTFDFKTSATATQIPSKIRDVKRYFNANLKGETMQHVLCLCSGSFFESLVNHETVKDAYHAFQGATPYRDDLTEDFVFNQVHFVEYEGSVSSTDGKSALRFIPEGEAIFIPVGTLNVFETVYAPADYIEAANTLGLSIYAKQKAQDFDKGIDVETQSNPLPICKRPDLLVRATLS